MEIPFKNIRMPVFSDKQNETMVINDIHDYNN